MSNYIKSLIEKINAGVYDRKALEKLQTNAQSQERPGSADVIAACNDALLKLPKKRKTKVKKALGKQVYWLAIDTNHQHSSYNEFKKRQCVAQGWSKLGDLSKLNIFKYQADKDTIMNEIVKLGDQAYQGNKRWQKDRQLTGTPKVFWNLIGLRKGDLIIALEGTKVCGICELPIHGVDGYHFDDRNNYAHEFGGKVDWIDWNESELGKPPTAPNQGVKGIVHCNNAAHSVVKQWESFNEK